MPKVSVIIPIFNTAKYLRDCLDSVTHQTLTEIEIICIDDGSTDDSAEIVSAHQKNDARITLISQKNSGQSVARNAGIAVATGEYIYFLDSDDMLAAHALASLYEKASKENLDILEMDARVLFDTNVLGDVYKKFAAYYERKNEYGRVRTGIELLREMKQNGDYRSSACLMLIRRTLLSENGIAFLPGIIHEDNHFAFCCRISAGRAAHTPEKMYIRRIRPDSTMASNETAKNLRGYFLCYVHMLRFIEGKQFTTQEREGIYMVLRSIWREVRRIQAKLSDEQLKELTDDDDLATEIMFSIYFADSQSTKKAPRRFCGKLQRAVVRRFRCLKQRVCGNGKMQANKGRK